MSRYSRRISGIERGYLNAATRGPHPTIHTMIDFEGRVPADCWRHASTIASAANPGMTVVRRSGRWTSDPAGCPVVFHDWTADPNDVADFHADMDLVTGPSSTLHVFEGAERTRITLAASHAVTDGRGIERFLVDLLAALDEREPIGSPDTLTDVDIKRSLENSIKPRRHLAAVPADVLSPLGGRKNQRIWASRTWHSAPGAMSGRIAAAVAEMIDHAAMIIIPVDIRRHVPEVRSTANLSAQLPVIITPNQRWQSIHGHLLTDLARHRDLAIISEDFRHNNPFASTLEESQAIGLDGVYPCAAIISDHGKLDLSRVQTLELTPVSMRSLPMLVPYSAMFISSCTVGETTTVTIAHRADDDPDSINTFFHHIESQMSI